MRLRATSVVRTRSSSLKNWAEELDWFSAGDEKLLGVVSVDTSDHNFVATVLARDQRRRFRAFTWQINLPFREQAIGWLESKMVELVGQPDEHFHQGNETCEKLDLFTPSVPPAKMSPSFRALLEMPQTTPAKGVIEAMSYYFEDRDGNFVEQFQSSGFDARIWELYLYAAFTELGYQFDRQHPAPDFHCVGPFGDFFVEATTVNPSDVPPGDDESEDYHTQYSPMKFGSALWTKLNKPKPYWELPHVTGRPLVLAVQDFHALGAMSWSNTSLREYLYGIRQNIPTDDSDSIVSEPVRVYEWKGKTIPAGFFKLPNAQYISAVIGNPEGTLTKFNRLGFINGFGDRDLHIYRRGLAYQGRTHPELFVFKVDAKYTETWCQGLEVFHNPTAAIPLPEGSLPGVAHTTVRNNQIVSSHPEFLSVGSMTWVLKADGGGG
jgi:hypothetical protein